MKNKEKDPNKRRISVTLMAPLDIVTWLEREFAGSRTDALQFLVDMYRKQKQQEYPFQEGNEKQNANL